jgi:hypothetical protein
MTEFELDDADDDESSSADEDADSEDEELSFKDNGKPANYIFAVVQDPDLGWLVQACPAEYWETELLQADWDLKLEVPGFTQEMEGRYTYDAGDRIDRKLMPEIMHRKFEKYGCIFNESFAAANEDEGCNVFRAP